jgi:hypothetical protein
VTTAPPPTSSNNLVAPLLEKAVNAAISPTANIASGDVAIFAGQDPLNYEDDRVTADVLI